MIMLSNTTTYISDHEDRFVGTSYSCERVFVSMIMPPETQVAVPAHPHYPNLPTAGTNPKGFVQRSANVWIWLRDENLLTSRGSASSSATACSSRGSGLARRDMPSVCVSSSPSSMSTSSCSVSAIESTTVEARESSLWSEGRVTGALGAKESVVCLAVFFAALEAPFLAEYNVLSH